MAEKKASSYVAVHSLEGGKDQFTVLGVKTNTVAPGVEFQTDDKTAAELLGLGAVRSPADAPVAPEVKGPTVKPVAEKDETGL